MYNNIYIHKYNIYIYMFLCTKYIYIYIERERLRERYRYTYVNNLDRLEEGGVEHGKEASGAGRLVYLCLTEHNT